MLSIKIWHPICPHADKHSCSTAHAQPQVLCLMRSGGFFWFRRTLREEHGGTFLVEVHAINHRVTPSPRPSQVKTQCFYLQLLQSKPQVSHPLLSTAELPPPKAPVVLTAPSGINGFSSPPPGSRDPAWFTHGLSAQAF